MKRGLWAFGGGVVVSLVTAIVLPNDRVRYGVLTLIGSCILIWILLDKVLRMRNSTKLTLTPTPAGIFFRTLSSKIHIKIQLPISVRTP